MKIKSLIIVAVLVVATLGFGFAANAQTANVQSLIAQLQAQIAQLLVQIQALQAQQNGTQAWCHTFNGNIGYANSGSAEVGQLHTALDKQGISYSPDTGNAYGEPTMGAVIQFQQKYSISPLSGYVGPLTRAKLNSLYGCQTTAQSTITITSPNGGEEWGGGDTQAIRWTSNGVNSVSIVAIDYSSTTPRQYTIASNISTSLGAGSYNWKVGTYANSSSWMSMGSKYKIGIFDPYSSDNAKVMDFSDNYFSIVPSTTPSIITVISPAGGETWKLGETHNITWTGNTTGNVSITAVSDPFVNTGIVNIATNIANAGSYSWSIPYNFPAYTYHIEILTPGSEGGWTTVGKSNRFTVASPTSQPTIKITSPMNLETWKIGETHNITWTSNGVNKVSIDLVTSCGTCANGIKLVSIASNISASMGTYSWTVPSTVTPGFFPNGYIIQISDQDVGYAGIKSSNEPSLNIVAANYITVTSPEAFDVWKLGEIRNITWTSAGLSDNVVIRISGPDTYAIIATVPASQGSYSWVVGSTRNGYTEPVRSDYKIEITDSNNPQISDTSDAYFAISAATP